MAFRLGGSNGSRQPEAKNKTSAEESKLNAQIADLQRKRDGAFLLVGKRYAELFGGAPAQELAGLLADVRAIDDQIKEREQRRRALRGLVLCERCGAEQDKNAAYCNCCGNRLIPDSAMVCPNCRSVMPEGTVFCTNCGVRLQPDVPAPAAAPAEKPRKCPKCGAVLGDGAQFCTQCGMKVDL